MVFYSKNIFKQVKVGIAILLTGSLLAGCGMLPKEEEILVPPLIVPEEISYQTVQPTMGHIEESLTGTGYFVPVNNHNYFFELNGGRFSKFYVKNGDEVKKGTLLAEMLTTGLDNELDKQLLYVDTLDKTVVYQTKIAELGLKNAQDALDQLKLNKASANDILLQQLKIDQLKLDTTYQLDMKENELAQAKIRLDEIKAQIASSALVSDIDGIVTFVADVKEGDYLDTYKVLVSVADPSVLQLEYNGSLASKFNLGMPAEVTLDQDKLAGDVVFIPNMAPSDQLERFKTVIRMNIKTLPDSVKVGSDAAFKIVLNSAENALIVPRKALKKFDGKDIVYTLEDGLRVENYVEIGVQGTSEVQILNGITKEDQIIIE